MATRWLCFCTVSTQQCLCMAVSMEMEKCCVNELARARGNVKLAHCWLLKCSAHLNSNAVEIHLFLRHSWQKNNRALVLISPIAVTIYRFSLERHDPVEKYSMSTRHCLDLRTWVCFFAVKNCKSLIWISEHWHSGHRRKNCWIFWHMMAVQFTSLWIPVWFSAQPLLPFWY